MKLKNLFTGAALGLLTLLAPAALAQRAGTYVYTLSGSDISTSTNNTVAPTSTNSYWQVAITNGISKLAGQTNATTVTVAQNVSEYDNVGITLTCTGTNMTCRIARSYDNGVTREPTPSIVLTTAAGATAGTFITSTNYSVQGCTHLFVTTGENTTAVGNTNATLTFNLKSPKFGARTATQ